MLGLLVIDWGFVGWVLCRFLLSTRIVLVDREWWQLWCLLGFA